MLTAVDDKDEEEDDDAGRGLSIDNDMTFDRIMTHFYIVMSDAILFTRSRQVCGWSGISGAHKKCHFMGCIILYGGCWIP